jgi:hypothetical protein
MPAVRAYSRSAHKRLAQLVPDHPGNFCYRLNNRPADNPKSPCEGRIRPSKVSSHGTESKRSTAGIECGKMRRAEKPEARRTEAKVTPDLRSAKKSHPAGQERRNAISAYNMTLAPVTGMSAQCWVSK